MKKHSCQSGFFSAFALAALLLQGMVLTQSLKAGGMGEASQKAFPSKPIQLVVPLKPGGDTDQNGRIFARYLSEVLGVTVVVVNIDGASGTVGTKNVVDAKPDGYTALFFHTESLLPKLAGMVDYDLFDLKMVGNILSDNTTILATHKNSGFKTLREFTAKAKSDSKKMQFGMATGAYPHLIGIALRQSAGVDINIVDVGGNADKTVALLGHKIEMINTQYGLTQDYFKSGDFICLGLLSENRNPLLSDIPTVKEQGYNMVFNKSFFMALPKNTPDEIRNTLGAATKKVCDNPAFKEEMAKYFIEVDYKDPVAADEYWKKVSGDFESFGPALKAAVK
ncbi:MAG: tripartite tricarboxylate transporter substrate binding protein [Treponema sp.]|nr:tripartite tricarboxylate transporter substrate binding protein [Treponema sp.]